MFWVLVILLIVGGAAWGAATSGDSDSGIASWYGKELAGRPMANGEPFDPNKLTCASWDFPLGTRLEVRNKNRVVFVTVTDRGPAKRLGRKLDLSRAAFQRLANPKVGLITVSIRKAGP